MIRFKDVSIGDVFSTHRNGDCKILEKIAGKNPSVRICFIDTGYETITQFKNVSAGSIRDKLRPSRFGVGYEGVGDYKFKHDGKDTPCTVAWKSMLERCYCPKYLSKNHHYRGCSVVDEWHDYQNFAKWWYENHPNDGEKYQVDKDLKVKGNKVYGPDTCTLLTREENIRISKQKDWVFASPEGEVVRFTNLVRFCRDNGLVRENMGKVWRGERVHCSGWTKYGDGD